MQAQTREWTGEAAAKGFRDGFSIGFGVLVHNALGGYGQQCEGVSARGGGGGGCGSAWYLSSLVDVLSGAVRSAQLEYLDVQMMVVDAYRGDACEAVPSKLRVWDGGSGCGARMASAW